MGWLLLRTLILIPVVLAVAAVVLLLIGLHAVYHKLFGRGTCAASS
ncbi:MAG: hypothetical protein JO184_19870 [Gammaproteobacteria bacterium]|nr:hypothetical protein [Gammaproteobacteria bacterium]MBV8307078.1 hypothetical protein [Gammaproteobacteria bacterium]